MGTGAQKIRADSHGERWAHHFIFLPHFKTNLWHEKWNTLMYGVPILQCECEEIGETPWKIDRSKPSTTFLCVCVKSHTFNKSVQSIRIKNNQVRKCLAKAKAKIIDLICLVRLPQVNLPIRTFHSTTARERSFVELYQLRSKLWISFEWNEYEYNGRVSMNSWTKNHHFVKRIQWKQWQN